MFAIVSSEDNPDYGRFMVASRDIDPGEIILLDQPLVFGPWNSPSCLKCLRKFEANEEDHLHCDGCQLRFCSSTNCMAQVDHGLECQILREICQKKPSLREIQRYQLISLIRLILAQRDSQRRGELENLTDGKVLDPRCHAWKSLVNAFEGLDHKLTNGENLLYLLGVRKTNAKAVRSNRRDGFAIYPQFSLINHNCEANTTVTISRANNLALLLTAKRRIQRGSEITTAYLETDEGQPLRRLKIWRSWHFACHCTMCGNTSNAGVRCPKCPSHPYHHAFPVSANLPGSPWLGEHCGHILTEADILEALEDALSEHNGDNLHPHHFLRKSLIS